MIDLREIFYGLYGAYRLCRFDPQGLAYFNATHEGFWRSFFSAVLVAPIQIIITLVNLRGMPIRADFIRAFLIETLAYIILVFAYPLVMYYVAELLDRRRLYVNYVVAYNWVGVILALLALPIVLLGLGDVLPHNVVAMANLAVTIVTLVMLWYIAKVALQVPGLTASGLVVLDVTLGYIIRIITDSRLMIG